MSGFAATSVTREQLRTVYPLVREAVPGLDLRAWLTFGRRMIRPRRGATSGIIAVRRHARPMPCGVFIYHCENDLTHGAILVAEHFVAVDVLDPRSVMLALTQEMDRLASRLGCAAIRAVVRAEGSLADTGLQAAGLRRQGSTLWKRLPASDPPAPQRMAR